MGIVQTPAGIRGLLIISTTLFFQLHCKRVPQQGIEPTYGRELTTQNSVGAGEFLPPSANGAEVGFGLQCSGGTADQCSADGGGAAGGTAQATTQQTESTGGASTSKPIEQYPGHNGTYAAAVDPAGKTFYQAFDGTQWRTTRDKSVAGQPFGEAVGNSFAAWKGGPGEWQATQYARSQEGHTLFQNFDKNPYDNKSGSWNNFEQVNSQFNNGFKSVTAGNIGQLDPNLRYTYNLGDGAYGVPIADNNFAMVNGRFDSTLAAGMVHGEQRVPVFTRENNGFRPAGAYQYNTNKLGYQNGRFAGSPPNELYHRGSYETYETLNGANRFANPGSLLQAIFGS